MAVSLVLLDLLLPIGELDPAWLPSGDMNSLVMEATDKAAALVEANPHIAEADHNNAAAAWVYARAYRAVASHLASKPQTAMIGGQVTRIVSADRIDHFRQMAEAKEAEYAAYTLAPDALDTANRSQSATVSAVW